MGVRWATVVMGLWVVGAMLVACGPGQGGGDGIVPAAAVEVVDGLPRAEDSWPQFRGVNASGLAREGGVPTSWDAAEGSNVAWRTAIPGLGHSSPVVWGDRLFVTTAVGDDAEPTLRIGLYGESPDNPEPEDHDFVVLCLARSTGEVLWQRVSHTGAPRVARHVKASHASSTVATDGERVVAFFGSEGLYAYDLDGTLLWSVDLGLIDSGALDLPELQWGSGSSPILVDGKVVIQCDANNRSFIAALDAATGAEVWRTERDEVPTWGTPTVVEVAGSKQVIVNGYKHIGAYDLATGEAVWWMRGGGDIPVPTPVVAHGLVFITNSHGRQRPIYAIRLEARGDITLAEGETSNEFVAWSDLRRGAYMPTPIVVGDELYVLADNGVLTCYDARTGEQHYRERVGGERGAYTASPVAAGSRLFIAEEHGTVHVVATGRDYRHLAANPVGAPLLASPAMVGDTLFLRTSREVIAVTELEGRAGATGTQATPADVAAERAARVFEPPAVPPTDPVAILTLADAAAEAVAAVRYRVEVSAEGAAATLFPRVRATVVAAGLAQGLPELFRIEAEVESADGSGVRHVIAGSDGNAFYLLDLDAKVLHRDFDAGVMGALAQGLLATLVLELHVDDPFAAEIAGRDHAIVDQPTVDGAPCWSVFLQYAVDRRAEVVWTIAKGDYLPRSRVDRFDLPDGGGSGSLVKKISELEVDPGLAVETFAVPSADGLEVTDRPG